MGCLIEANAEVWDEQFPGHPLTRTRAWLRDLDRIVAVDPAFAALPDFRGTTAGQGPVTRWNPGNGRTVCRATPNRSATG
jgi:hypothetical protein